MILAGLVLRDYKQFAGEHELTPDRQGITAVIGPNGAGKTTLFEAIEWCLYGPRSISNVDVLPRGLEGRPLVRVTLEEPVTGQRFVIERRLRGRTMQADIWDEENPGEILATGSAPVRKFVGEQLIGLGHDAFVSTFFTRQKELSFFGSLRATERRVMVGRLIGVETVRLAQEAIGTERAQAASRAEALATQVESDRQDRDLDAELAAAAAAVEEAAVLLARRDAEHAAARQALETAASEVERIRFREAEDRRLADRLAEIDAVRGRLESRMQHLEAELARLAEESHRKDALAPLIAQLAERQARVEAWVTEQRRQERVLDLRKQRRAADDERTGVVRDAIALVRESATPLVAGWRWERDGDPGAQLAALLGVAASVDAAGARAELAHLQTWLTRRTEVERAQGELTRFRQRLDQLRREEGSLAEDGDPAPEITRLTEAIEAQRALASKFESERDQAANQAHQVQPLLRSLQSREFDDHCPTCGRSISESEAAQVIATLAGQIDEWRRIAHQRDVDGKEARGAVKTLDQSLKQAQQRAAALGETRVRLADGAKLTADKAEEVSRLEAELTELLRRLGRDHPPSQPDLDRARERADALGAIAGAAQGLAQCRSRLQALADRDARLTAELETLGEPVYDRDAHQLATAALKEATEAVAAVAQIDRDLARVPALTAQRDESVSALAATLTDQESICRERATLGYHDDESVKARAALAEATTTERRLLSTLHLAQTAHRERRATANHLTEERDRLERQFQRSLTLRREADELDRMYREFASFDQFVAARIAPRLAEQTSELLDIATDGKFSHVAFDENYGIHVYDGVDEKFPLDGFSGGERDVVALCARLALSQVIGSSAARPPSFLVLDEVFGALDRDRRVQLLELLGRISESIDAFQQMFIISHVDDVRASPIFSRVLRVTESTTGASRIEDATRNPAEYE